MAKSATERRKHEMEEQNLLLNPMMDMFAVLIPALLMMSVVVEVTAVNVSAPGISGDDNPPQPDKPPLNLTVTVTDGSYKVSGTDLGIPVGDNGQLTIPITEKSVLCSRYRGTVPPPRTKNTGRPPCQKPDERRMFWIYDVAELHRKIVAIKDAHPDEYRVIIAGEASIDFEPLADVMDATRDTKLASGEVRDLFPEVVISPGNP